MKRTEIDEVERRLRRQRLPAAPESLAGRIMAAAGAQPAVVEIDWSDRLWFSRPVRLGWTALVLLLLAAEIVVAPENASPARPGQSEAAARMAALAADLRLDSSWGERLVAAEASADSSLAELQAAVNAL